MIEYDNTLKRWRLVMEPGDFMTDAEYWEAVYNRACRSAANVVDMPKEPVIDQLVSQITRRQAEKGPINGRGG